MTFGIFPNVLSLNLDRAVNSVTSARWHTGRLKFNPAKNRKKDGEKSAVAVLKDARQLGCVLQDTESEEPKSFGINSVSAIHKSYASCTHPRKQRSVDRKN